MPQRDSCSPMENSMYLLRVLEYPQLHGKTYLDHAGTTPWAKSLINSFAAEMMKDLYGNPHSEHGPSKASEKRVDKTRRKALEFFNADPADWDLIFTANTTSAIKLVHDGFRDHVQGEGRTWWYGYHKDSHTSLVGVREGTPTHRCFKSDQEVELWIEAKGQEVAAAHDVGLFAYPAQSNMNGRRLPLDWSAQIRSSMRARVYTLLDAAALAATAELDLADAAQAPDFVALSFYKIFGFPNLGALLVKKSAWKIMESRRFFGGGTVEMVIAVDGTWARRKNLPLHSRLEDGTLPFTTIFALDLAIDTHRKLYGPAPMKYISMHTTRLIKKLYDELVALRHSNGVPVVKLYRDKGFVYGEPHVQAATIAFNVQRRCGGLVEFMEFEAEANKHDIYVRSGSLCNPGGTATYLNWEPAELKAAFEYGHKCSAPLAAYRGKPLGCVRVSLGAMTNDANVDRLVRFIRETYADREHLRGVSVARSQEMLIEAPQNASATVLHVSDKEQVFCVSALQRNEVHVTGSRILANAERGAAGFHDRGPTTVRRSTQCRRKGSGSEEHWFPK